MHSIKQLKKDLFWVGGSDRRLSLFENVFPVPAGMAYNSYLITDEKTVLLDTVDQSISRLFFENLTHILKDRPLDFVVINHMEPDHCSTLQEVVRLYPNIKIVGNSKTITIIKQFFDFDIDSRSLVVSEGDTLCTGAHTLAFYMAPMVHWPETMVVYDTTDRVLFSADAFGTFGAINGNIFADEMDFENRHLDEARRYYANIVGKYGNQVQSLLKKISALDIQMLCPLHGPVWRENIKWFVEKYNRWSQYLPEDKGVVIAYGTIYGNTENAADILASKLSDLGVKDIGMYDVSSVHPSFIVSECFRASHIVIASSTYNNGIFCNMETLLLDLKAHNLQNRIVSVIENGSWAPNSGKQIKEIFSDMKNITILQEGLTIKSALKEAQIDQLDEMAREIALSVNGCSICPI